MNCQSIRSQLRKPIITDPANYDESILRPEHITSDNIGQRFVVEYDKNAYPGIISAVDGDVIQVRCMHRVGINRFSWNSLVEDITSTQMRRSSLLSLNHFQ